MLLFSKPKPKQAKPAPEPKPKNGPKLWNSRGANGGIRVVQNGGIRVDWFAEGRVSKKPKPKKCWKHFPCAESDFPCQFVDFSVRRGGGKSSRRAAGVKWWNLHIM